MTLHNLTSTHKFMRYLVLGGGIAGVCCAEELSRLSKSSDSVILVSSDNILKVA